MLESTHPAVGNKKYTYEHPEEAAGLLVTFSYKTYLYGVFGTNSLLITDEEGNSQEYNKNSLSGVSLVLGAIPSRSNSAAPTLTAISASGSRRSRG